MSRCEDWPCCGHDMGACPDPDRDTRGWWPLDCVECGFPIRHGDEHPAAPSLHRECATSMVQNHPDYRYGG